MASDLKRRPLNNVRTSAKTKQKDSDVKDSNSEEEETVDHKLRTPKEKQTGLKRLSEEFFSAEDIPKKLNTPTTSFHPVKHTSLPVSKPWLKPFAIILVLIFLLTVVWFYNTSRTQLQEKELQDPLNKFLTHLSKFEVDFPLQKNDVWKVLKVALKPILKKEEPLRPSVVVLVATYEASSTLACFARRLAHFIEALFQEPPALFIHLDSNNHQDLSADQLKKALDEKAHDGFTNGSHAFLIENIQQLPGNSALMFHGLCDDTNAPFKKVIYLLTMTHKKEDVFDLSKFEVTSLWKQELKVDVRSALESRIGALKANVQEENHVKCT